MFRRMMIFVLAFAAPLAPVTNVQAADTLAKGTQANVDVVVKSYLSIQKLLADDKVDGVAVELKKIRESAKDLAEDAGDAKVKEQAKAIAKHAANEPKDVKTARASFKTLSAATIGLVKLAPPTADAAKTLYEASCPMAKANWLQETEDIANPYMGKEMLTCGTIEREIKPAAGEKAQ